MSCHLPRMGELRRKLVLLSLVSGQFLAREEQSLPEFVK